jgi:hypothetical protein
MTTTTLTLAEFLLARIAEDEAWASSTTPPPTWFVRGDGLRSPNYPARVLVECEAKRRIVENVTRCIQDAEDGPGSECLRYTAQIVTPTLYALALPYADHPDYREEWRP